MKERRPSVAALDRREHEQPDEHAIHISVKAGDHEADGAEREKRERPQGRLAGLVAPAQQRADDCEVRENSRKPQQEIESEAVSERENQRAKPAGGRRVIEFGRGAILRDETVLADESPEVVERIRVVRAARQRGQCELCQQRHERCEKDRGA